MADPIRAAVTGSDTCQALGITVRAYAPVLELCRRLVAAGMIPSSPSKPTAAPSCACGSPRSARRPNWKLTATEPALDAGARRTQPRP